MKTQLNSQDTCARSASRSKLSTALAFGVSAFCMINAAPAVAQEDGASRKLDTVVVTARKTEENLQTTPIAVTALGQEALQDRQIVDIKSIEMNAPNVFIQPSGGGAAMAVGIRGQNQSENASTADPAVGLYVDGVYMARSGAGFTNMLDVAGVEVLRGTQGTLFGRNTTGGALNISTNLPTGEFEGKITGKLGNYNRTAVEGFVNVPIVGDQLAARVAFSLDERDGYGESLTTGQELGNKKDEFIRGSLLFSPGDGYFEGILRVDHFHTEGATYIPRLFGFNADHPSGPGLAVEAEKLDNLDFYDTFAGNMFNGEPIGNDLTTGGASLELKYDFGFAELKSITGYRTMENRANVDIDGTGPDSTAFQISFAQDNQQDKQISQELQLSGDAGPVKWIAGLYYFDEENSDIVLSTTAKTFNNTKNGSKGAFAQATYEITNDLRFTGGLRYTEDERETATQTFLSDLFGGSCSLVPGSDVNVTDGSYVNLDIDNCVAEQSVTYDYVSYLLNLDYQLTDNIFGYVKTSRANRSGGFNNRLVANAYSPEEVTDYEVGIKSEFFDSSLRVNAAVFLTEYKDAQRAGTSLLPNGQVTQLTTNAADAEIPGFELEVSGIVFDGLEIGGSVGILDAKYTEYIIDNVAFDPTQPESATNPATIDLSDQEFDRTADYTYGVYAKYTHETAFGEVKGSLNYAYKDDISFGATEPVGLATVDGYGILNGRASIYVDGPDLEFALFGQNLLDEEYHTYVLEFLGNLGYAGGQTGTPRFWGIEVSKKF